MEKHQIKRKKAFTLVELIIVITILAVLATIAFVSFQNYTKSSRDANRISTLKSIEKGLNLYNIKSNTYPNPEESVEILGTGSVILSKQGIIGNEITQIIKLNKQALDPKDKTNYVYSITGNGKKFQLGTFLEENKLISYFPQILKTYATNIDYTNRYFYTIGDLVGIFIDNETNQAISPEDYPGEKLDLTTNSGSFKVIFSNDTQSGSVTSSGTDLIESIIENQNTIPTTQTSQQEDIEIPSQPKSCNHLGEVINHNGNMIVYSENNIAWNASYDCSDRVGEVTCNDGILSGDTTYQYKQGECAKGIPTNCIADSNFQKDGKTFNVPQLNHSVTANPKPYVDRLENNGTYRYLLTVTCTDGTLDGIVGTPTLQSCSTNYHTEDNSTCISNTKSCSIENGVGQQTWNGTSWGTCQVASCNSGYVNQSNICVLSNQTSTCTDSGYGGFIGEYKTILVSATKIGGILKNVKITTTSQFGTFWVQYSNVLNTDGQGCYLSSNDPYTVQGIVPGCMHSMSYPSIISISGVSTSWITYDSVGSAFTWMTWNSSTNSLYYNSRLDSGVACTIVF